MGDRECEMPGELLSSLIDEELTGQQRLWVAEHAAGCDDCATQLGRLVAAKEALKRDDPLLAEAPVDLFERLRGELDHVDKVARAASGGSAARPRYLPALAVVGALLVIAAVGVKRHYATRGVGPEAFVHAHESAGAELVAFGEPSTTYNAVSVGQGRALWRPVWQGLLEQDGGIVRQTVYLAGRLPVSSFVVSADAFRTGDLNVALDDPDGGLWLGEYYGGSVAAVPHGRYWEILVARTSPDHLAELARTRLIPGPGAGN